MIIITVELQILLYKEDQQIQINNLSLICKQYHTE